jgi:hypothetical protein
MTRQDALQYLNTQLALVAYATDCDVGTGDNPAGWAAVINATFLAVGADIAGPTIDALDADCRLLLRYFALEQFTDLYAARVDLSLSTVGYSKQKSQAYRALAERLKDARAAVEARGYLPGATAGPTMGRVTLDFLEPVTLDY